MPEQASTGKKLRASSRIAAGVLGVLSVTRLKHYRDGGVAVSYMAYETSAEDSSMEGQVLTKLIETITILVAMEERAVRPIAAYWGKMPMSGLGRPRLWDHTTLSTDVWSRLLKDGLSEGTWGRWRQYLL
jgi:hypothetical protein